MLFFIPYRIFNFFSIEEIAIFNKKGYCLISLHISGMVDCKEIYFYNI